MKEKTPVQLLKISIKETRLPPENTFYVMNTPEGKLFAIETPTGAQMIFPVILKPDFNRETEKYRQGK